MEKLDVVLMTVLVFIVALAFCLSAYQFGANNVRGQAIAAGVACYQVDATQNVAFKWNCK